MTDSPPPSFAELEADPEIPPLLDFTPVPRSHAKANGWSAEMQRMFIAWLAHYGSPTNACDELGKARSGIDKVYKDPAAAEFRAAWDAAVALAEKRRISSLTTRPAGAGAMRAPTLSRGKPAPPAEPIDEEFSEDRMWELIHSIGLKFMRKVAAEREARLNGEIVAADFYLRQITFLEVVMEMTSKAFGWDVQAVLRKLRRGDHHITEIVNTELSDWMDRSRRLWWAQEGEPERPPHPDVRFLQPRRDKDGAYGTALDHSGTGACTTPARGYSEEEWAAMNAKEQLAAREAQNKEDAEAQASWEQRAYADYLQRASTERSDAG